MKTVVNQNGFTYILALTVIIIMGIMLSMIGQSWKTIKQRELEEELVFRGDQIAEIIYQKLLCKQAPPPSNPNFNSFLWTISSPNGTILDELVTGKEESCVDRKIRKFRLRKSAALDPLTGKQWQIVKPVGDDARFAGVKPESKEEPLKKSFKDKYDSKLLDDKKQYSDWLFTSELKQALPPSPIHTTK